MADVVSNSKKIVLLHRYPADRIRETNAAFPYLKRRGIHVRTFKKFDRTGDKRKFLKSLLWIFYAPCLVIWRGYDVIYCDDSFPFYPLLVKMVCPKSKVVIRLGDLHLMYYTSGWLYKHLHKLEVYTWKKVDAIYAISEVMADYVRDESDRGVDIILDPVEPKDFTPDPSGKSKQNIVMFHGLINKNKNLEIIVRAAADMPDLLFWVIGTGPDLSRIQAMAPDNVIFNGWHSYDNVSILINNCDIGLSLRSDNPGNEYVLTSAFLQYGVMGKPCLVTRRKVFGDYPWQFSGTAELVQKIRILLKKPEEGKKLRKHILRKHNANKIAGKLWNLLQQ